MCYFRKNGKKKCTCFECFSSYKYKNMGCLFTTSCGSCLYVDLWQIGLELEKRMHIYLWYSWTFAFEVCLNKLHVRIHDQHACVFSVLLVSNKPRVIFDHCFTSQVCVQLCSVLHWLEPSRWRSFTRPAVQTKPLETTAAKLKCFELQRSFVCVCSVCDDIRVCDGPLEEHTGGWTVLWKISLKKTLHRKTTLLLHESTW